MPQPRNEKVEVKLPSGETVVAIVPAGMDDTQVGALMRQKHPEYFPKQTAAAQPSDDDRSQIAGAMARMPQSDTTPESQQGPVRRFAERAFGIPDRVFDKPGEYLNPFSSGYWNPSPQRQADIASMVPSGKMPSPSEMVPGRQTVADIKAGNYAGAAGDVLPDAIAVAQMAVPAAGEVMQIPAVARNMPRVGRYTGAGVGLKAGGPVGAVAGGLAGDLAARGLVKAAPRMARSVGVAAPAETSPLGESNPTASLANELMRLRNPELFDAKAASPANRASRINQILQASKSAEQRPVTTPTEPAAPTAAKPTVNVDDLVSTGRNLGLSPADAKARAQEAISQFPNDEKAAIAYMAGRKAPTVQEPPTKAAPQPAAKTEQPAATTKEAPGFSLGSMKDYSAKGQSAAKAEQIKAVQQEKAGIVNNPEYVSPRQRSNLAKNQRDMAARKASQVANTQAATQPKQRGASQYMNEILDYGGEPTTRADILRDLKAKGLSQPEIDRYMQGRETGAKIRAAQSTQSEDVEDKLQRSIKTLKTPVSGGSQGADLKSFADMVNNAANDMQGQGVHRHGIGDKVFISEVYERLKPKLGQMTLDQFKQKILEARRNLSVISSAADQAPMFPKTHQVMNARSKTGGDNSVSFIDAQGK